MAQRILAKAQPHATSIDCMIRQLETTLGKPHSESPFTPIFTKYGLSTKVDVPTINAEETKEVAKPAPKKEKQPKAEKPKAAPVKTEAVLDLSEELAAWNACDLRVGKIVECTRHPESAKLYIEKIDLGEGKLRTIGSGLQEFVPLEQMTEGLCVVFANLKPRKLADIMSEGMVMCAGNADHTAVEIMRPPAGCKVGERVQLEGNPVGGVPCSDSFQPILNPKKKFAEKLMPLLETNDKFEGMFNGVKMMTSQGAITCVSLKNCHIS